MKHKFLPRIYGSVYDYHPRMIPEDKASYADDVMFKDGNSKLRWGYDQQGTNLPLNGAILGITHYKKLSTDDEYIVVVTTEDVYKYDVINGDWELITRSYNTGTVTSSGTGDRTITLSDSIGLTNSFWTVVQSLNTARYGLAGCGTQGAGLSFGGNDGVAVTAVTEEYNGATWSTAGSMDLNTARVGLAGCGTQGAGLSFGGSDGAVEYAVTEEYNGATWTMAVSLNPAVAYNAGCGTQGAGLSFGGYNAGYLAVTEEYNGATWYTAGSMDLNTAVSFHTGCGTQGAGLSFGGNDGVAVTAVTEEYNGATWYTAGSMDLNTARVYLAGCGTQGAGLSFGGSDGAAESAVTEEYNGATWTTAVSLNTERRYLAGCGTQGAGLSFGGYNAGYLAVTEKYKCFLTNQLENTYEIGFNSSIINSISTWYSVKSIDTTTQLTLGEDLPATVTAVDFVLKYNLSGNIDNNVSFSFPFDDYEEDFVLISTNGVNEVERWNGKNTFNLLGGFVVVCNITNGSATVICPSTLRLATGNFVYGVGIPVDTYILSITNSTTFELSANATATSSVSLTFSNMPEISKFVGFFGSVGYEHVVAANSIDSKSIEYVNKISLSYAGEPEQWSDDSSDIYYELLNTNSPIKGIMPLFSRLFVYKEHSISTMMPSPSGGNTDPFDFMEDSVSNIGTPSFRTVCNLTENHIFFGEDNFYIFNGTTVQPIGDVLKYYIDNNADKSKFSRAFAFVIQEENLYICFMCFDESYPDKAFAYNYKEQTWTMWSMAHQMTAAGQYQLSTDSEPVYLLGDKDGYIYKFSASYTDDDGTDIESSFITRDYEINDPKHTFRLLEVVLGLENQEQSGGVDVETNLRIRVSIDFGQNWSAWVAVTLDGSNAGLYEEYVTNFIERGRQVRFEIQNTSGSPFKLESLDIGYNDELGVKK